MSNGHYLAYENCLDDAFDSATATLVQRIAVWGAKGSRTAEWIRGQDQVFANCAGHPSGTVLEVTPTTATASEPTLPPTLPAGTDPLLAADRQYQIAAALFYAGRFDEAEERFREMWKDANSPWHEFGPYLAARAMIRQGTVEDKQDKLELAEKALREILNDPKQKPRHKTAEGLVQFVEARLHPEDRLVELGAALSKPGLESRIEQAIIDYTAIWNRSPKAPVERSALADWISAFQTGDGERALRRWHANGWTPWLVAVLVGADPRGTEAPQIIAEARKMKAADPAYATAALAAIRLQVARGEYDEARQWADEALAHKLSLDAQNAFRAVRSTLAGNWNEFLRYAPRRAVAAEVDVTDVPLDETSKIATQAPIFDRDAADVLNRRAPLDLWVDAGRSSALTRRLQLEIAQAGWVRAVLLNHMAQARLLASRVGELQPELAEGMRTFATDQSSEGAKFDAVFLMLRTPGLGPEVRQGFGRDTKADRLNMYRENWWNIKPAVVNDAPQASLLQAPVHFISEAQLARGEKERADLEAAAGTAPSYLCAGALAWARAHPADARVPEALHLCVRATRYGVTDKLTTGYSRQAFRSLHSGYPNTEWAKRTKYWY